MSETALARTNTGQVQQVQQAQKDVEFQPYGAADRIKLNVKIVQTLCAVATRQGHLPTEQDAMRFMMLCRAQRLNPFAGDAFLIGYDTKNGPKFNLITAHQAFLKRAEVHPEFDGMSSGVIVAPGWDCIACNSTGLVSDNGKPTVCPLCLGRGKRDEVEGDFVPTEQELVGAWAHVKLKNRSIPTHRRIDYKASKPEFGGPIWDRNPAMMLVKTAEADALRSTFPTLLGGLYTAGEQPIDLLGDNAERSQQVANLLPPTQTVAPKALLASRQKPAQFIPPTQTMASLPIEATSPDEQAEAAMGLAPEPPQKSTVPQPAGPGMSEAQAQVSDIVGSVPASFDDFAAWGRKEFGDGDKSTGLLAWDSMTGFGDVPEKFCALVIRAKTGAIAGIKAVKEGGAQ